MVYSDTVEFPEFTTLGAVMETMHYSYDRKDLAPCVFLSAVRQWPSADRLQDLARCYHTKERKEFPALLRSMLQLGGLQKPEHPDYSMKRSYKGL